MNSRVELTITTKNKHTKENKNSNKYANDNINEALFCKLQNSNLTPEKENKKINFMNPLHFKSQFFKKKQIGSFRYLKLDSFNSIKMHRRIINRQKRKKLIKQYGILKLFWNCTSKVQLMQIFQQMTLKWKKFLKFYLSRCLIFHLTIRQLKNVSELMRHRQNLYDCVNEPELLVSKINFSNNLIKNFCKGVSNFFIMFYDELVANQMIPSLKSKQN